MEEFITIVENVTAEIVEKKSKFIASIFYVDSIKAADEIITNTKKKYFDARHNCVAYRIVEGEKITEKASDDGEPSGTAGGPMLNILQKNNLANVLVIVTRYFGGILLGTGGLVRAYSDSTLKALEETEKVIKTKGYELKVEVDYNNFERFKYYCNKNNINIINSEYLEFIVANIELEKREKERLIEDFGRKSIILKSVKTVSTKYITKSI